MITAIGGIAQQVAGNWGFYAVSFARRHRLQLVHRGDGGALASQGVISPMVAGSGGLC